MDGFVLPPFESIAIFKDTDLIRVKKKGTKFGDVTKEIKGLETLIQDEIIEKQLLPSDIKLLANEEYNKETGGYESETDDAAGENVLALENSSHGDIISKKRKASNRVGSSKTKTKRQRHIASESVQKKPVNQCEQVRTPEKKGQHENETRPEVGIKGTKNIELMSGSKETKTKRRGHRSPESVQKKPDRCEIGETPEKKRRHENEIKEHAISHPEVDAKWTNNIEPTSDSKESGESEKDRKKTMPVSPEPSGAKKVSRSTQRKRVKRQWQKEQRAKAKMENQQCEEQPVKDPNMDSRSKAVVNMEDQQADENSDAEDNLVPVMIRPGHIRFTSSAKAKDVQPNPDVNGWGVHPTKNGVGEGHSAKKNVWGGRNNEVAKETFQWNGITNKRKGQKWGTEKQPTSSWKESRDYDVCSNLPRHDDTSSHEGLIREPIHSNGITNNWNGEKWGDGKQPSSSLMGSRDDNAHSSAEQLPSDGVVDFEKLVPLTDLPKAGDVIAYRLVELSSSWCPELSSFRVGKVSWFQPESNRILLVPDPEYPLNLEKKTDHDNDDDDSGQPPQFSLYDEDGSLEIDFPSLVDVHIIKCGDPNQSGLTEIPVANGMSVPSGTSGPVHETHGGSKDVALTSGNGDLNAPIPVNGKKDLWEEISEALSAKKAELTQEDGWDKKENPAKRSWSRRGSALGPIMERLRSQNAI